MTMSHHPPDWLLDGENVATRLRPSARIQLWGHKHVFGRELAHGNLVLAAGVVEPHRAEDPWDPRYNYLELSVDDAGDNLIASVDPRVWHHGDRKFVAEDGANAVHHLALREADGGTDGGPGEIAPEDSTSEDTTMTTGRRRRLLYRFSALPYQQRLDIGRALALVDDNTGAITDGDLFQLVLAVPSDRNAGQVVGSSREPAQRPGNQQSIP